MNYRTFATSEISVIMNIAETGNARILFYNPIAPDNCLRSVRQSQQLSVIGCFALRCNMDTKRCRKCWVEKSIDRFSFSKERKGGRDVYCKDCRTQYTRDNKERMVANATRWNKAHPDRTKEIQKKFRKNHPENLEADRIRGALWRTLFPEKSKAASSQWKKNHPEEHLNHWHNRRALIKGNGGKVTTQEWEALKKFYNFTCLCCRRKEPEIKLTRDHVLPLELGGVNTIDNIQPLCKPCNSRKHAKHIDYR